MKRTILALVSISVLTVAASAQGGGYVSGSGVTTGPPTIAPLPPVPISISPTIRGPINRLVTTDVTPFFRAGQGSGGRGGNGGARGGGNPGPGGRGAAPMRRPAAGSRSKKDRSGGFVPLGWEWWWHVNEGRFMNRDTARSMLGAATDGGGALRVAPSRRRALVEVMRRWMLDADAGVRAEAIVAIARCGDQDSRSRIINALDDKEDRVRQAACMALGILGGYDAVKPLCGVASGERRVAGQAPSERMRRVAVLGLSLVGLRDDITDTPAISVLRNLAMSPATPRSVRDGAFVALGDIGSAPALASLRELVADRHRPGADRAAALASIGRIARDKNEMLAGLKDRDAPVRRAAAAELGRFTLDPDDVKALRRIARADTDKLARHLALISIAEGGDASARDVIVPLVRTGKRHDRDSAAIALALHVRRFPEGARPHLEWMAKRLSREKGTARGALAVALGLAHHRDAAPAIRELLTSARDDQKRYLAEALGLLGDRAAVEPLATMLTTTRDLGARVAASRALGLIGGDASKSALLASLERRDEAAAFGLALVGLERIDLLPLLRNLMAHAGKGPTAAVARRRVMIAGVAGALGERDVIPVIARPGIGADYSLRGLRIILGH